MVGSDTPPPKTPSAHECKYCAITKEDCPSRIEPQVESQLIDTLEF
jgi:hypothetical protein